MNKKEREDKYRLISKSEAARLLAVGKDKLNGLLHTGKIRCVIINSRIRIPLSEIESFITSNLISLRDIPDSKEADAGVNSRTRCDDFDSPNYFNNLLKGE